MPTRGASLMYNALMDTPQSNPSNSSDVPIQFLASVSRGSDTSIRERARVRAERIAQFWRQKITDKPRLFRRQADFHELLATAYRTYAESGTIDTKTDSGRLLDALRPGPINVTRGIANGGHGNHASTASIVGERVEHALPYTNNVVFTCPFPDAIGLDPYVALAEFRAPQSEPRYVAHLGEIFIFALLGAIRVECLRPQGRKFVESSVTVLDARLHLHYRAVWMKSECGYRLSLASGERAVALLVVSDPGKRLFSIAPSAESQSSGKKTKGGGLHPVEISGRDDQRLWSVFSGIGARVERHRRRRGMSTTDLGKLSGLSGAHVSRIEDGLVAASIETAASLAAYLDTPLSEILPDDVLTLVKGFYLTHAKPLWSMLTGEDMPSRIQHTLEHYRSDAKQSTPSSISDQADTGPLFRVRAPFMWRDRGNVLVLPTGSPRAKALTPFVLDIGRTPAPESTRAEYFKSVSRLAEWNHSQLSTDDLRSFAGSMLVLVTQGTIRFRIARYADYHLFPISQASSDNSIKRGHFADILMNEGDLFFVNCLHMHKFEPISDTHCSMLCVLGIRRTAEALSFPSRRALASVLPVRGLDADFWTAIQPHMTQANGHA